MTIGPTFDGDRTESICHESESQVQVFSTLDSAAESVLDAVYKDKIRLKSKIFEVYNQNACLA